MQVEQSRSSSVFSMTPYEMLMDDIRARRFQLAHVEPRVKKEARNTILEFIKYLCHLLLPAPPCPGPGLPCGLPPSGCWPL